MSGIDPAEPGKRSRFVAGLLGFLFGLVGAEYGTGTARADTDVAGLGELAAAIPPRYGPVRDFAVAQAAATQHQEEDIEMLLRSVSPPPDGGVDPGPTGGSGIAYWDELWTGGAVPANWSTEINTSGLGDPGKITYSFVTDPLGTYGTVLRLRCEQDPAKSTSYNSADRQLVSLYRGASVAHSGYQQVAEETWYRVRFMFPSGAVFSNGDTNFLVEFHTDGDTQNGGPFTSQGVRGNSSGLYLYGGFPLVSGGTTTPGILLRWNAGPLDNQQATYWPSVGSGSYADKTPIAITNNHWYESLWHVIWSKNSGTGKMEWWLDGDLKVSRTMATCYENTNLLNDQSYQTFGVYDYRYNVSGTSTVYFDRVAGGPDQASVS